MRKYGAGLKNTQEYGIRGGLKRLPDDDPCRSPQHFPPAHISLDPGKYEYECLDCGKKMVFRVPGFVCQA